MLALLLVAPTFCAVSIPTVPTAAPTPGTVSGDPATDSTDDGPPSVAVTEAPAPTSTVGSLYGTTAAKSS